MPTGSWLTKYSNNTVYKPAHREAPGTSTSGAWKNFDDTLSNINNKLWRDNVINLKTDFSAAIDGSTDDTTAWNNALSQANGTDSVIFFPAGTSIISSVDATEYSGITIIGEGRGSILKGTTADKNILDLTGSSHFRLLNFMIQGDTTNVPGVGLLLARESAGKSAGFHKIYFVDIEGNFATSGVYNYASEVNEFVSCKIDIDAGLACMIFNENNTRSITSDGCTIDTDCQSATNQTVQECILYNNESSTGGVNASILEIDSWQNFRVIGNTLNANTRDKPMIWLRNNRTGVGPSHPAQITIEDNNFHATYQEAIYIDVGSSVIYDLTINKNRWGTNSNKHQVTFGDSVSVHHSKIVAPNVLCIGGKTLYGTWTQESGSIYYIALTTECTTVYNYATKLTHSDGNYATLTSNQWDWDSNKLYVNIGEDPTGGDIIAGASNADLKNGCEISVEGQQIINRAFVADRIVQGVVKIASGENDNLTLTTPDSVVGRVEIVDTGEVRVYDYETVTTAAPALTTFGVSKLDSTSNAVNSTLADGTLVGQRKTVVMTEASNESSVKVANHYLGTNEFFYFDAVDDLIIFEWGGNKWTTVREEGVRRSWA
jgi:hypothetical protein